MFNYELKRCVLITINTPLKWLFLDEASVTISQRNENRYPLWEENILEKSRVDKVGYAKIHNILSQFTGSDTSWSNK